MGRKIDKEKREESTYKDKLIGAQATIKSMLNPKNTRQKVQAKGAAKYSKGK